ncbi:MAG: cytochrome c oxidase subunit II [Planctomycetes bacterium]|nr:cytochrome c oxidase subunit II [Planctomycetota bacterium]
MGTPMLGSTAAPLFTAEENLFHRLFFLKSGGSDFAVHTDETYMWIWWFCVAWFVFLMGLMVYFVVKYRRKRGQIAPQSSSHNTALEVAWTVIPTLMLVYIFFRGFWGYMDKVIAPGEALEYTLIGKQWQWQMIYPNGEDTPVVTTLGAKSSVPVYYLPAEVAIRLRMNSQDVMHAFWVPDFRTKQDVLPNRYTTMWFRPKAPPEGAKVHPKSEMEAKSAKSAPFIPGLEGVPYEDHWVFCAEYCGDEHSEMAAILRVVPEDAWKKWMDWVTSGDALKGVPPEKIGEKLYQRNCQSCHSINGSDGTGPSWKNMYGHDAALRDGTSVKVDDNYIRESILNPTAKVVKGYAPAMPVFNLKEKQILQLIAYMKTLSDAPEAKLPTPGLEAAPAAPAAPAAK